MKHIFKSASISLLEKKSGWHKDWDYTERGKLLQISADKETWF